jgi:hypothetical protein
MVIATGEVYGLIEINGTVYKAHYSQFTGQLELKEHGPEAQPSAASPQSASGQRGNQEQAHQEQTKAEIPEGFKSMKIAIERVLRQNRVSKLQHNQLKGKLDLKSKSLVKSQTGSKTINVRKGKTGALGYNIILLVDNSGSMTGRRIELANEVAIGLHATLKTTDGINVKVSSFTDNLLTRADWTSNTVEHMEARGGNADAAACYVSLTEGFNDAPNPEYRNILLVLSDGSPCPGRLGRRDLPQLPVFATDSTATIAQFVSKTARRHQVYVAGLGIQYDSTQIPNSMKIDNLSDVQRALITVLKGAIDRE